MKNLKLLSGALLFLALTASAQPVYISVSAGASGYNGDLQATYFNPHNVHSAAGFSIKYNLSAHWTARIGYQYGFLSAADVNNDPGLQFRNLSFSTGIHEGNIILEYDLVNSDNSNLIPYAIVGVGLFHFNPYYRASNFSKVYLQPMGTEGQNLGFTKPYKLTQKALISGGGMKFKIRDNVLLSYEMGMRKLSTDYLDDVSTFYYLPDGDPNVKYAYKESKPYVDRQGEMRGSPKVNDYYYFNTLSLTFGIGNINFRSKNRGSTRCPTRF